MRPPAFVLRMILMTALVPASAAAQATPPGHLVDLGGFSLHYIRSGHGSTAVVLIHGGGDSSLVWQPVMSRLDARATAFAFDSHGRGYSEWGHRDRTLRQIAADLRRALTHEGIEGPYVLVGHSLGGLIAQYFARQHPDDVAGVVLVDPTPLDRLGRYEREDGSSYLARDRDLARDLAVPDVKDERAQVPEATEEFVRRNDYSHFANFLDSAQVEAMEASTNHPRLRPRDAPLSPFWSEELRDLAAWRQPGWLGDRPLRILANRSDYSAYPDEWFAATSLAKASAAKTTEDSIESYTAASSDSALTWTNLGHHIQIEDPDLVVRAIAAVLDSLGKD